jgi:hypothetical protein
VRREAGYGYAEAIKIGKSHAQHDVDEPEMVLSSKFWVGRSVTAAGILADGSP